MIAINPQLSLPLVRQVYDAVLAEIMSGVLPAGARLPSVRKLAQQCSVSTLTVTNAYQRLVAEGHIQARPASGYYVALEQPDPAPRRRPFQGRTSVDSLWLLKHVYDDDRSLLNEDVAGFLRTCCLAMGCAARYRRLLENRRTD